jgi:hypothetical protein
MSKVFSNLKIIEIRENESILLDLVRLISAQLVFWGHLFSFLFGPKVVNDQVK